jgi:hypothetical protein
MKHNLQLKVQAWVDGELTGREARQIGEWVARDAEAGALAAALGSAKQTLRGNEVTPTVSDTREFYWSKIERQIQFESRPGRRDGTPWYARWKRLLAPAAGVAVLACAAVVAVHHTALPAFDELAVTGENMEAVTFHDQSAQMTVVWLQDNTPAAPAQNQKSDVPTQDENDSAVEVE